MDSSVDRRDDGGSTSEHSKLLPSMASVRPRLFLSALPPFPPQCPTLSLLTPPLSAYPSLQNFSKPHLHIPISDTADANLLAILPAALRFISEHRSQGVLVHCMHGVSRSVSAILAYVLCTDPHPAVCASPQQQVASALEALRVTYPAANPSDTFLRQLAAFAQRAPTTPLAYVFPPSPNLPIPSLEAQEILASITSTSVRDSLHEKLFLPDPNHLTSVARCRKCRADLLPQNARLNPKPSQVRSASNVIPVLPVAWMRPFVLLSVLKGTGSITATQTGRLRCPRCTAKVGRFNMAPISCFELVSSAVDVDLFCSLPISQDGSKIS